MRKFLIPLLFVPILSMGCATTLDPERLPDEVHIWGKSAMAWQIVSRFPCAIDAMVDGRIIHFHGIGIGCIEQSIQVLHHNQDSIWQ